MNQQCQEQAFIWHRAKNNFKKLLLNWIENAYWPVRNYMNADRNWKKEISNQNIVRNSFEGQANFRSWQTTLMSIGNKLLEQAELYNACSTLNGTFPIYSYVKHKCNRWTNISKYCACKEQLSYILIIIASYIFTIHNTNEINEQAMEYSLSKQHHMWQNAQPITSLYNLETLRTKICRVWSYKDPANYRTLFSLKIATLEVKHDWRHCTQP